MFICIITMIDLIMYTASVSYNGIGASGFLAPSNKALFDFGEKVILFLLQSISLYYIKKWYNINY